MLMMPPPRARVLKQAYEVKDGLPDQLQDRTSVVVAESTNFLSQQIAKLRLQVADARRRRGLAEHRRQQAREESEAGERRYRAQVLQGNCMSGEVIFNSQRQLADYKV